MVFNLPGMVERCLGEGLSNTVARLARHIESQKHRPLEESHASIGAGII